MTSGGVGGNGIRDCRTAHPTGELSAKVAAVIARELDLPPDVPLLPGTRLLGRGLGLDSLAALRLVAALEEEFGVTIDDDQLTPATFESVGSLVAMIDRSS
jgi:acyl carrier protein